jgi:transcription factor MBP1
MDRLWRNEIIFTTSFVRFSNSFLAMTALHLHQNTLQTNRRYQRSLRFRNGETVSQQHTQLEGSANSIEPVPAPRMVDEYDNISAQLNDDESMADDATVASASFMGDDDRYDMSAHSTGHRKRKREEQARDSHEQAHLVWADELLDYFMTTHQAPPGTVPKPEPPPNFDPNFPVDNDRNNGLHWSASMGDVEAMKQMKRFGADLGARNDRGETPLIRAVLFTNSFEKQTMPAVVKELSGTLDHVDNFGGSALHHAANITMSKNKNQCARYYLDVILNKMQEVMEPEAFANLIDAQDINGDTALHLAARNKARKCVRALMGRGASVDIANNEGDTAQDLITALNVERVNNRYKAASSSPFAPAHRDSVPEDPNYNSRHTVSHLSEAAMTIENKITPILLEKMRELAASFDDELNQQDEAEKNAKMILAKTQLEHSQLREEALEWEMQQNDPETERRSKAELAKHERNVTSLVEQQQQIQLNVLVQQEESNQNGYMYENQDIDVDMAERLQLAKMLLEEEAKRKALVVSYVSGLAKAGTGEKGEKYRRLISKAVDKDPEMVDEALDGLLAELKDERASRQAEVVDGGGESGY